MEYAHKEKDSVATSSRRCPLHESRQADSVQSRAASSSEPYFFSSAVGIQLQEENARLYNENTELREQLRLTTQQLTEAMAALARAMEFMQRVRPTTTLNKPQKSLKGKKSSSRSKKTNSSLSASHSESDNLSCNKIPEGLQAPQPPLTNTPSRHEGASSSLEADVPTYNESSLENNLSPHSIVSVPKVNHTETNIDVVPSGETMVKMPREQYKKWLTSALAALSGNDIPQRDVWEVYRETFPKFAPGCPLSLASDLLKLTTEVFPQARCMSIAIGAETKFIVRGVAWNVS